MTLHLLRTVNDRQESLRKEAAARRSIRQPSLRARLASVTGFTRLAFGGGYASGSIASATH